MLLESSESTGKAVTALIWQTKAECGTVQENGCHPDIVSVYSYNTGIVLATEACEEKNNEIKVVPQLIDISTSRVDYYRLSHIDAKGYHCQIF